MFDNEEENAEKLPANIEIDGLTRSPTNNEMKKFLSH